MNDWISKAYDSYMERMGKWSLKPSPDFIAGHTSRDPDFKRLEAENKKLSNLIGRIANKLLFRDGCRDIMYMIEEALKDGE